MKKSVVYNLQDRLSDQARLCVALVLIFFGSTVNAVNSIYWTNEFISTGIPHLRSSTPPGIRIGNLDGSGSASTLITDSGFPIGVALDPAAGNIYWADFNSGNIMVANIDGTGATPLYTGLSTPLGLTIDPVGGYVYWATNTNLTIQKAPLNGLGPVTTLYTEPSGAPDSVAIDAANGLLYWTNFDTGDVRRGDINGANAAITLFSGESNPFGVAIDLYALPPKIYWANTGSSEIRVGNIDGSGTASTLFTDASGSQPIGLALDHEANKIYWADWFVGLIQYANLDGTGSINTLFTENSGPPNFTSFGPTFPAILKIPEGNGVPCISGTFIVGNQLSCSTGLWAPDQLGAFLYLAPQSFAYSWSLNGVPIPGATMSTFTPSSPGFYTCTVTATNHAGSAEQTSCPQFVASDTCP